MNPAPPASKSPRSSKRILWLGAIVLMALAVLCLSQLFSGNPAAQAEVRFIGYTTNATGMRLARFEVENKSSFSIQNAFFQQYQVQTGKGWHSLPFNPAPNQARELRPGEKEIVEVSGPPQHTGPWRLRVTYISYKADFVRSGMAVLNLVGISAAHTAYGFNSDTVKP